MFNPIVGFREISNITICQVEENKLRLFLELNPAHWSTVLGICISAFISSVINVGTCYPNFSTISIGVHTFLLSGSFIGGVISSVCYIKVKRKIDSLKLEIFNTKIVAYDMGGEETNHSDIKKTVT